MASQFIISRKANPITATQFLNAFQRTWFDSRRAHPPRSACGRLPRRLGLAISGGADSMALAYLCRQWELNQHGTAVMAFVVDHRAREESSREARTVARWLGDMGLTSHILPLTWPQGGSPSEVSAFETHARRLRFQALGQACRDNGIETLLMGHHQDDNVETTLWRLCTGARGAGLAGIPPVTGIPECHGLYGVSGSGGEMILQDQLGRLKLDSNSPHGRIADSGPSHRRNVTISTGGISICRPLLGFPKDRLIATCEANDVPFVTDKTNFDPTLTPRNAIRSLLAEHRLPRALQPPSILSLIKASQDLLRDSTRLSNRLLRECRILDLNLNAGTMTVEFPEETVLDEDIQAQNGRDPTRRIRQIQALSLRRITEILSPFPDNHFALRGFENFIDRVFSSTSRKQKQQAFTLGGVLFKPLPQKGNNDGNRNDTWLISRQPFMRHRLPTLSVDIPIPSSPSPSPSLSSSSAEQNQTQETYTPWQLWDNRYWFRFSLVRENSLPGSQLDSTLSSTSSSPFHSPLSLPPSPPTHPENASSNQTTAKETPNPQSLSLTLRPLQQSDLEFLRKFTPVTTPTSAPTSTPSTPTSTPISTPAPKSTPAKQPPNNNNHKSTLTTISRNAPSQTRFTLPVLLLEESSHGRQIPLALPTLETACLDPGEVLGGYQVRWEWMFKSIDGDVVESMNGGFIHG